MMYDEAVSAPDLDDRRPRIAWALKSESRDRIRAMIEMARGELAIAIAQLDANPSH